jgi:hypothetical protein
MSEQGDSVTMDDDDERLRRLWNAGLLAGSVVAGSIALIAPFVVPSRSIGHSKRYFLPYMATPKDKVKQALDHTIRIIASANAEPAYNLSDVRTSPTLASDTSIQRQRPRIFVDLGSGDGEAVRQAVLAGYDRAVGLELNYTLYLLSQVRRFVFWSAVERQRSQFLCQDLFTYRLAEADTVMIFGIQPLMRSISSKLAKECRPGTTVLSYRFELPVTSADKDVDDSLLDAQVIYYEQEMRVYQKV